MDVGAGEDVEDIMWVVDDRVGDVILELVGVEEVMLLGRVSMLAILNRMFGSRITRRN